MKVIIYLDFAYLLNSYFIVLNEENAACKTEGPDPRSAGPVGCGNARRLPPCNPYRLR